MKIISEMLDMLSIRKKKKNGTIDRCANQDVYSKFEYIEDVDAEDIYKVKPTIDDIHQLKSTKL